LSNTNNVHRSLLSMCGCLSAAAAAGLVLSTGAEAQAPSVCTPLMGDSVTDYASNYGSKCTLTVNGTLTSYGLDGVCLASIHQALSCASQFFNGDPPGNYTIIIGNGSPSSPFIVDLSHDISQAYPSNHAACYRTSRLYLSDRSTTCRRQVKAAQLQHKAVALSFRAAARCPPTQPSRWLQAIPTRWAWESLLMA
jgi:hypothetical protein